MPQVWEDAPSRWDANTQKFLDFLGKAEGAGYNTIVGGGSFNSYDAHPNTVGLRTADGPSTAAGRYQITGTTYRDVAPKLGINDFSPDSQDRIAVELMRRAGALGDVQRGDYQTAINKLGGVWASLPSSNYNQPKKSQSWVEKALDMTVNTAQAATNDNRKWEDAPVVDNRKWEDAPAAPSQTAAPAATPAPVEAPKQRLTDAGMNSDPTWISNAKRIYKETNGKDFKGSDTAAADWLKNYVAQTNWNLGTGATSTIIDAQTKLSGEGKKALLDSLKAYEEAPTSWESVGRAVKGIVTDPTTYLTGGVGSTGAKLIGRKALTEGVKQAIKSGLEKELVTSATKKAVGTGAAYGVANDLANQEVQIAAGGQESLNPSQLIVSGAAGGATGGALNKLVDKATGRAAVRNFVKNAGDEAGARTKAEIAQDLGKIADNPNMEGQAVQAVQANNLEQRYVNDVMSNIKAIGKGDLEKMGVDSKVLQEAVMARKIITPDELNKIRGNPAGDALADAIEKAQRTRAMTQAVNASTNPVATLGRSVSSWLLPERISSGVNRVLGSRKTREQVIQDVLNNQKAAKAIGGALGKSDASISADKLAGIAKNAKTVSTARQAVQQSTRDAAKSAGEQLRIRNLQMGIRSNPKFVQGDIGGGTRGTLQYYGRLADSKELAKGLKIIEKTDPYLAPYIASVKQNKSVPNKDILLGLSDRLLKLRDDGILKPYIK